MSMIFKQFSDIKIEKIKKKVYKYYDYIAMKNTIREEEQGILGCIIEVVDFPFHYIRKYTIPPGDEDDYYHHYTVYWPFLGVFFLLFAFIGLPSARWLLALPFILVLFYYFWKSH